MRTMVAGFGCRLLLGLSRCNRGIGAGAQDVSTGSFGTVNSHTCLRVTLTQEYPMRTIAYDHQIFSIQQFGGVSRYFCELATRVGAATEWSSVVIAPMHFNEHLATSPVRRIGCYLPKRVPYTGPLYRAVNRAVTPFVQPKTGADLLHRTYYSRSLRPSGAKVVVTVFDLIHEVSPQYFSAHDRAAALKSPAVADADAVICISQSTANDLQRLLNVPSEKISVIHLGFSSVFAQAEPTASAAAARPYLLYVGQRTGYKNFARMLEAYGASPRLSQDFDLVTFGGSPLGSGEVAQIDELKLRPNAVRHHVGGDHELARAYAGARALVYPSEYEGFGIPLLEAMSAGCPVICSNVSSMPEVAGDAAEYFDPRDVEAIRLAVERVVYDDENHAQLVRRGYLRCKKFSWQRCANEHLDVYKHLLA